MRKAIILIFTISVLLQVSGFLYGAIPAEERAALIALYNAADGDSWMFTAGWKSEPLEPDGFGPIGSEDSWSGVYAPGEHVISIWIYNAEDTLVKNKDKDDVTCFIPPELGNLGHLESLTLSYMRLTGDIPTELGNMEKLSTLDLSANNLNTIPSELGNLNNLRYLYLHGNQLTGSIPPELGNLSNLNSLYLGGNQLTGSIPPELGNLSNVESLYLNGNQLTGSIPPELGNLSNLNSLYLNGNQLTGSIPPELGNLSNLRYLKLQANQLTGNIPSTITNLTGLYTFGTDFGYNGLHTDDEVVRIFLNSKDDDWEENQTTAPSNISAAEASVSSIRVSWTPITYTGDTGGYLVYYSTTSGGPWTYAGMTPDKSTSSYNVTNLSAGITYYFTVKTQTDPHKNNSNTVVSDYGSETSCIIPLTPPLILISRTRLNFGYAIGGNIPTPQTFIVSNIGADALHWTASASSTWISCSPNSGVNDTIISVSLQPFGLAAGSYTGTISISDPNAINSPQVLTVNLKVYNSAATSEPFGEFETPTHGSTISSSIPVTGWVLDDVGVRSLKIYRDPVESEGGGIVYIGDALFVEGARPDVEGIYPEYPMNSQAGWGYMMLTNFLPNGGNGIFTIHAIATDIEGNQALLGTKTIFCNNADAVKPFGAIDTPIQGGTASGGSYRNNGWVLTPIPNIIPVDGSTIDVYVDGVYLGHPLYDMYREDIATLFPGYTNSSGAWAYFDFDTTCYTNGVHTIYWTAKDDAGNSDGIGSRYFVIQNTVGRRGNPAWLPNSDSWLPGLDRAPTPGEIPEVSDIPVDYLLPVGIIKGYNRDAEPQIIYPDPAAQGAAKGIVSIEITELERIEIRLVPEAASGLAHMYSRPIDKSMKFFCFQIVGRKLRPLPIGSTLDSENGIFFWSPGPGFIGTYRLVFIEKRQDEERRRIQVEIKVKEKIF